MPDRHGELSYRVELLDLQRQVHVDLDRPCNCAGVILVMSSLPVACVDMYSLPVEDLLYTHMRRTYFLEPTAHDA